MMSKQNVPELRFPEFSGEWEIDTFNEIFDFYNNKRVPLEKGERKRGPYPYYGATGIIDYIDDYIFEGEYLLIGEDGANIVSRNAKLVYFATGKFWVNNHAHILKPKMGDNYFFYNALERINYVKYNSGTAQPKLNHGTIKKIKVSYPQIEEQNKIGNFLSKLDRLIELEEKKLELLEEQKKGYMQKIFSQELRFKDENGNDYPEWEVVRLGNVVDFQNGKPHESLVVQKSNFILVNSKFISSEGNIKKYVSKDKVPLRKKDIAIVMSDVPNGKALAKCFYIDEDERYSLNQRIGRLHNFIGNTRYLYFILNRNIQLLKYDNKVGQTNLKKNEILNIFIEYPSKVEQDKIGGFLHSIDKLITKKERKIILLYRQKSGLLQKIFV